MCLGHPPAVMACEQERGTKGVKHENTQSKRIRMSNAQFPMIREEESLGTPVGIGYRQSSPRATHQH